MRVPLSTWRHGWGLVAVIGVLVGVVVALGLALSDRHYLTAMVAFATVVFLALMAKTVVTGLRRGRG